MILRDNLKENMIIKVIRFNLILSEMKPNISIILLTCSPKTVSLDRTAVFFTFSTRVYELIFITNVLCNYSSKHK